MADSFEISSNGARTTFSKKHPVKFYFTLLLFILPFRLLSFSPINNEDARLNSFSLYFISKYWQLHPVDAIYAGYHLNDSIAYIPDKAFFSRSAKTLKHLSDTLATFNENRLSAAGKTDLWMMRDKINADLFYLNDFREYEWNPAWYNIGGENAEILNNRNERLERKLMHIMSRLRQVSAYYASAKANIRKPVIEHTELAILQNEGTLSFFEGPLLDSLRASSLSEKHKETLNKRVQSAVNEIRNYISWLKVMKEGLTADNSRSFRLGKDLYFKKFNHDLQSAFTAEQVYRLALERKTEVTQDMAKLSKVLWEKYFSGRPMPDDDNEVIRMMIARISNDHTTPDSFLISIREQIPELEKFVREKDLLWIDPEKPLVVRQTPAYMEGSGAPVTISSPGPYDKGGNTYYNVTLLTGYDRGKAESYLREYNRYTMQILNIHEAIPGHYTQLVYSNRSPSMVKSLFGNGAMIEGWAVYSERMMLEEGYGANTPEMWLMYYKWHLRSVCNTILDYEVHVNGWNEKVAIHFLTRDAFQETAEAEGKWRRVRLTQVQLCSYFTGYSEIYELRNSLKLADPANFSLKDFHEKFLSYGSAPVKYISVLMKTKP
jgi:uncharacterized protein (DUF885 family)